MALTATQTAGLDTLNQKIAGGYTANATDQANLAFGAKQGYKYAPKASPSPTTPTAPGSPTPPASSTNLAITPPSAPAAPDPRAQFASKGYTYLNTMDAVNNAIRQYGKDRVQIIGKDYYLLPKNNTLPPAGSPIPASGLPVGDNGVGGILNSAVNSGTVDSTTAGTLNLLNTPTTEDQNVNAIVQQISDLQKTSGNEAGDLQTALNAPGGATDTTKQLTDLNAQIATQKGAIDKFDAETQAQHDQLGNQAIPTGLIRGQQAQLLQQRSEQKASMAAELSANAALAQAYQGNINTATKLATDAVTAKYAPVLANITALQTQLTEARDAMTKADANRADIIHTLLTTQANEVKASITTETAVNKIVVQAAANGAPLDIINQMKAAQSPADAAAIGNQYIKGNLEKTTKSSVLGGGVPTGGGNPTPTSFNVDTAKPAAITADYQTSLKGLAGHVQVKAGQQGITREAAIQTLFDHYKGKIPLATIQKDVYKQYPNTGNDLKTAINPAGTIPTTKPNPNTKSKTATTIKVK